MKDSLLALISLVVAVCALGTTLLRTPESTAPVVAATSLPPDLEPRIASLEESLSRIGEAIGSLRLSEPSPREPATSVPAVDPAVESRVVELERQIGELTSMVRVAAPRASTDRAIPPASDDVRVQERQKAIEHWTRATQDVASTEAQRIEGLRGLRGARLADGTDARLGVLPDVLRLAEQSSDEKVRADVWRQLHGVNDRSLIGPLVHALQNDPAEKVREEAAESLDVFLSDPSVRRALEYASEHDPSARVRSQARESLAGER